MTRVALSLGANLGDRVAALQHAVDVVSALGTVVGLSDVYETDPVGGPEQPEYYNAVVVVETDASAQQVLAAAHRAEQGKDRTREVRWGPRTLDVDVLAFGDRVSDDPDLTLPHPRATERAFVMIPWAQVDPQFVLSLMREKLVALDGASAPGAQLLLDAMQEFLGVRGEDDLLTVEQAILEEGAPDAVAVVIVDRIDDVIKDDDGTTLRDIFGE